MGLLFRLNRTVLHTVLQMKDLPIASEYPLLTYHASCDAGRRVITDSDVATVSINHSLTELLIISDRMQSIRIHRIHVQCSMFD